jgi:hypothetical protein
MGVFDSAVKKVKGFVAHGAADDGTPPLKVGGVVRETFGGSDISGDDVGELRMDRYQRIYMIPTGDGAGGNATSPPRVYARPESTTLILTPGAPTPTGTDIVDDGDNDIVADDLTITDTNNHYFVIPMAASNYRSAVIFIQNGTTSWDQTATVTLSGAFKDGSAYLAMTTLETFTLIINSNVRYAIGTNAPGAIGGRAGTTPSSAGGYDYYSVPAISDGFPYLMLNIKFSVAPGASAGRGIQRLAISRMRF